MRLTADGRYVVAVHVESFRDLAGAVYTVAMPDPRDPARSIGETFVVESWALGSPAASWAYACMQAALCALENGYRLDRVVVRGGRSDLGRLLNLAWDGTLGEAVMRFRVDHPHVRFQYRAGEALDMGSRDALTRCYRDVLTEHLAECAA